MVLVDANVLVYAINEDSPLHHVARRWLRAALSGGETVGFAWLVVVAFLRIATLRGAFPRPLSVSDALDVVDDWLAAPMATTVHPTARHAAVLRNLLVAAGTGGNLITDAHLAALALEHGASLASFDREFGRFPGLRSLVPG